MTLLNYIFELRTGDILDKNLTNANLLKRLLQQVLAKQPGGGYEAKANEFLPGGNFSQQCQWCSDSKFLHTRSWNFGLLHSINTAEYQYGP